MPFVQSNNPDSGDLWREEAIGRATDVLPVGGANAPALGIHNREDGHDTGAIIAEYPQLQAEDVAAAIDHERRQRENAAA